MTEMNSAEHKAWKQMTRKAVLRGLLFLPLPRPEELLKEFDERVKKIKAKEQR